MARLAREGAKITYGSLTCYVELNYPIQHKATKMSRRRKEKTLSPKGDCVLRASLYLCVESLFSNL
jgi:hypothetical protein